MAISPEVLNTTYPNPGLNRADWRKKNLKKVAKKLRANDPMTIKSGQTSRFCFSTSKSGRRTRCEPAVPHFKTRCIKCPSQPKY